MNSGRTKPANARPRAPRFQFSIWAILVLTTATAVVLSVRGYYPEVVDFLSGYLISISGPGPAA